MSKLFNLNLKDLLKGLFLVILTSVITIVYQTLQAGSMTFDLKSIGLTALTAGLAYIVKQFTTNSNGDLLKSE